MSTEKKIELLMSDTEIGCERFGYIPRVRPSDDEDEEECCDAAEREDEAYEKFVQAKTGQRWVVQDAILYPHFEDTM